MNNDYTIDDFIGVFPNGANPKLCDWLVQYMDKTVFIDMGRANQNPHRSDKQFMLDTFSPKESKDLVGMVGVCLSSYINKVAPIFQESILVSSLTLLQKTEPTEGFHSFHEENSSWNNQYRTMAWMVYLNDVEEGGETEFLYQQKKVKPEKGKLVIWPGAFTHLHRGNPPMSTKYIATGWFQVDGGSFHERVFKLKKS